MTRTRSINSTLALATLALSLTACGGDGPTASNDVDLSGTFNYEEIVSTAGSNLFCVGGGTLTLQQSGSGGTGSINSTGECDDTASGSQAQYTHSGAITELSVQRRSSTEAQISFRTPKCRFDGFASRGGQTTQMAGTVVCQDGLGTVTAPMSGSWVATK